MHSKVILVSLHLLQVHIHQAQYQIERRDPLADLSSSLSTRQSAACDGDNLQMECPPSTKISIQLVQYGRLSPQDDLCPANIRYPGLVSSTLDDNQEKCLILEAIRTVEEKCHSKESCSVTASPEILANGLRDPCPTVRKYVEVLYKCKPVSFRSRVVCGGESVSLSCQNPATRLAIFSATFSTTSGGHVFCPTRARKQNSDYRMQNSVLSCDHPVTNRVKLLCHGYSDCTFSASPTNLGGMRQCIGVEHLTLKVTFACVDKSVFHSQYIDRRTTTSTTTTTTTTEATTLIKISPTFSNFLPTKVSVIKSSGVKVSDDLKSQESKVNLGSENVSKNQAKSDVPAMLETNSNFQEEHKSKLLVFSALVATICLFSSLLFILMKLYQGSRLRSRRRQARDLDTVSTSELDLSVDLQLHESAAAASSSSCTTLLTNTISKSEFKPKGILKNSRTSENFRLYNNPVDDNIKCSTMGRHQGRLQQQTQTSSSLGRPGSRTVMNRDFLLPSQSDIEDQLEGANTGVTKARLDSSNSEINPYFDKSGCQSASSPHPQPSSEITSQLIEHLLKLRATSSVSPSCSSPAIPLSEPSGSDQSAGGVRTHINSCLNDTDYSSHIQEVTNEASPFVDCLQNLVPNDEDDDKLFIL